MTSPLAPSLAQFSATFRHLSANEVVAIARDDFGISVREIRKLTTERDDTFLIEDAQGAKSLLKVAHPADDRARLALQDSALALLGGCAGALEVPTVVAPVSGRREVDIDGSRRVIRLLGYIEGALLHGSTLDRADLRRVGRAHGMLAQSLAAITTELVSPATLSSLDHAWVMTKLPEQVDDALSRLAPDVARAVDAAFRSHAAPALDALRDLGPAVAHNDFHGRNVLVANAPFEVVGVIDFGDIAYLPPVADLAVAASYADRYTSEREHPWANIVCLADGHADVQALGAGEWRLLPDLVIARVLQRIVLPSTLVHSDPSRADELAPGIAESVALLDRLTATRASVPTSERGIR